MGAFCKSYNAATDRRKFQAPVHASKLVGNSHERKVAVGEKRPIPVDIRDGLRLTGRRGFQQSAFRKPHYTPGSGDIVYGGDPARAIAGRSFDLGKVGQ